jgi:hypothetical protein
MEQFKISKQIIRRRPSRLSKKNTQTCVPESSPLQSRKHRAALHEDFRRTCPISSLSLTHTFRDHLECRQRRLWNTLKWKSGCDHHKEGRTQACMDGNWMWRSRRCVNSFGRLQYFSSLSRTRSAACRSLANYIGFRNELISLEWTTRLDGNVPKRFH